MKTVANVSAAILLAICSTSAMAEDGKFYGAIDLGHTKIYRICDFSNSSPYVGWSCKDTASAVRIAAGYQLTPAFGMEVSYGNFGTMKLSGPEPYMGGISNIEIKLTGYAVHATGTLPINDSISLFGKLGIARTTFDQSTVNVNLPNGSFAVSTSSTKASFGMGAKYAVTDKLAFRAQYEKFGMGGDSNVGVMRIDLLSAGAVYKF